MIFDALISTKFEVSRKKNVKIQQFSIQFWNYTSIKSWFLARKFKMQTWHLKILKNIFYAKKFKFTILNIWTQLDIFCVFCKNFEFFINLVKPQRYFVIQIPNVNIDVIFHLYYRHWHPICSRLKRIPKSTFKTSKK